MMNEMTQKLSQISSIESYFLLLLVSIGVIVIRNEIQLIR